MWKIFISSKREKGLTLVEALFSAGIISLAIVGILLIFAQTVELSKRVNYEYMATNLAKARIERAKSTIATSGFDSLPDIAETDTIIDRTGSSNPDGDFKRSTIVTANYSGNSELTSVTVSIIYKFRNAWKENAIIHITALFTSIG